MPAALTSLLLTSLLLVTTATVVFWALVGVVAADRAGRPRGLGLVSGLLPVLGPALVLALPHRGAGPAAGVRVTSTSERARTLRQRVPPLPRAAPPVLPPAPPAATPATGSLWGDPAPLSAPPPVAPGESLLSMPTLAVPAWPPPLPAPGLASAARADDAPGRRRLRRPSLGTTLLGAVAVPLLVAALVEPWLLVRITSVTSTGYTALNSPATAVSLLAAVLGTAAAVVLQALHPRGSWVLVAALAGTTAVLCGLELLLFTGAVSDVLATFGETVDGRADVDAGNGAYLLVAGGTAALLWSVFAVAAVRSEESA